MAALRSPRAVSSPGWISPLPPAALDHLHSHCWTHPSLLKPLLHQGSKTGPGTTSLHLWQDMLLLVSTRCLLRSHRAAPWPGSCSLYPCKETALHNSLPRLLALLQHSHSEVNGKSTKPRKILPRVTKQYLPILLKQPPTQSMALLPWLLPKPQVNPGSLSSEYS